MLPREPELERSEAARSLQRELVPVQRLVFGLPDPVVLGLPVERAQQILAPLHQERADVIRLEEPLVRVDRQRIGAFEVGHARSVPLREPNGPAVGRVYVEPEALAFGQVREVTDQVDRAAIRGARDGRDAERCEAGAPILGDRGGHRLRVKTEAVVRSDHPERLGREPEHIQRALRSRSGPGRGVDADVLELPAARGRVQAAELRQVDVAGDRQAHHVREDTARCQDAQAPRSIAGQVAEPADDLLLDERTGHAGEPEVDALVRPGGQGLADHGHGERRGVK